MWTGGGTRKVTETLVGFFLHVCILDMYEVHFRQGKGRLV